jgi:hypothetical protein
LKSGQAHVPSVTLPDRQSFTLIQVEEWEVPPATPFLSAIVAGRDELLEAAVLAVKN